jgi:hypothetical protein
LKKKETHIGKFFSDPLPEPEVSADNAWAGMNDMLSAGGGGTPVNGDAVQWFSGLLKMKGLILTSMSLVSVTAIIIYQLSDSPISNPKPAPALTQSEQPENRHEPILKAIAGKTERYNTTPSNPEPKETLPNQNKENPQPENNDQKLRVGSASQVGSESRMTELKVRKNQQQKFVCEKLQTGY